MMTNLALIKVLLFYDPKTVTHNNALKSIGRKSWFELIQMRNNQTYHSCLVAECISYRSF